MKLEFSRQSWEKYSNIKFHENLSSESRVVACGRTVRHDEANSRFSKFCKRAYKGTDDEKVRKFQEARNTTGHANMTPAKNYGVCVDMQQTGVIQPTDQICQTTRLLTSYVKECLYTY